MIARIEAFTVFVGSFNNMPGLTRRTQDLSVFLLLNGLDMMAFREICAADKHTEPALLYGHHTATLRANRTGNLFKHGGLLVVKWFTEVTLRISGTPDKRATFTVADPQMTAAFRAVTKAVL